MDRFHFGKHSSSQYNEEMESIRTHLPLSHEQAAARQKRQRPWVHQPGGHGVHPVILRAHGRSKGQCPHNDGHPPKHDKIDMKQAHAGDSAHPRWTAHLAAYWSDSDLGSLLVYNPVADNYNVSRQKTQIRGLEGNLAVRAGDAARLGVAYARTDGRYDRNLDGELDTDLEGINISPDRATAFWEQDWGHGVATRLQASHALDRDFERFGSVVARFEGYTTVDLQAAIALPVGRLSVGVENLLGKQYISYYSQTTPSNDDYVAGRGRVLSLAWSHRF